MREECSSFAEKLTGMFSDIIVKSLTLDLHRELEDLGLTLSQVHALTHVAERGKSSVGAIAEALGVTHPAAVKMVERLAQKELVVRGVAAADHRQSEITPTAAGRALVTRIRREREARLVRVLQAMEPEERQALIQGLQGFVRAALQDERALDALCVSCQAVLPTDCEDFLLIRQERLLDVPAAGRR
ncbi:MAG: MarR family transcriptional regulator [Armatimonadetes bacterium]|nr:MarR family transcriptional regulator [Armatimonadota bacterium]